jgi:Ig-like domain from next to BRCA1 gene
MAVRMQKKSIRRVIILAITLSLLAGGCAALRPVRSLAYSDTSPIFVAPTRMPTPTPPKPTQSPNSVDSQPANCTNVLSFEKDLTIPDSSYVDPGSSLDKQWLVKNSGTCNWNDSYSLRMIEGDSLGATSPQPIVPARGGVETTIRILFTAPTEPGNYYSKWKAYDADGQPFGDFFEIVINVPSK